MLLRAPALDKRVVPFVVKSPAVNARLPAVIVAPPAVTVKPPAVTVKPLPIVAPFVTERVPIVPVPPMLASFVTESAVPLPLNVFDAVKLLA